MTTIAWDGVTLAADRCSWGGQARRAVKKLHRFDDGIFAGCGDGTFVEAYAAHRRGERAMPDYKDFEVEKGHSIGLFVRNDGRVSLITPLGDHLPYCETIFAYGAGQEFAWGALEMGATAKQAVEIAAKRSDYSALGVDEMMLHA